MPIEGSRRAAFCRTFEHKITTKMETQHSSINPQMQPTPPKTPHPSDRSGRILGGAVIVAVGLVLLAKQAGVLFPWWFFSWEMILIVIGLFIGARNSFRDWGWIIPVAIGVFFLADDVFPDLYYLRRYFWPVIIIIIGLAIMFKSRRKISYESWTPASTGTRNDEDLLDSVTIFGGVKKNIISKDFRGGESVTVFGGTELNLLQADIQDRIVLELVQVSCPLENPIRRTGFYFRWIE
jgi:hypothetical protein